MSIRTPAHSFEIAFYSIAFLLAAMGLALWIFRWGGLLTLRYQLQRCETSGSGVGPFWSPQPTTGPFWNEGRPLFVIASYWLFAEIARMVITSPAATFGQASMTESSVVLPPVKRKGSTWQPHNLRPRLPSLRRWQHVRRVLQLWYWGRSILIHPVSKAAYL